MQQAVVVKLSCPANCGFSGAYYNEEKVRLGEAEFLHARHVDPLLLDRLEVLRNMGMDSGKALEEYLQDRCRTFDNTRSKRWQFHISISVKAHELDKEGLADLADRFMAAFGYGNQPYLVYFHHDTDNNHVHILSTNIDGYGQFINDKFDKRRMVSTMDEVLGRTTEKERQRMFSYSFQTEGQFLNIARSCGFEPKREEVEGKDCFTFFRAGMPQMSIPVEEIQGKCHSKDDYEDKARREQRIRQLRSMLAKYRAKSMDRHRKPGRAKTKKEVEANNLASMAGLRHKDGTPLTEQEQYQMKWFVSEVKAKLGLDIRFQKDRNGIIRGYGLVDHAGKMAFDGSQIMKLAEIIDYREKELVSRNAIAGRKWDTKQQAPSQNTTTVHVDEHSHSHVGEDSQTHTGTGQQAHEQTHNNSNRKEYVHDSDLDLFDDFFTASVICSADGDFVTIRWQDGSTDWKPLSAKQASWYAHAGSKTERQDIATRLALTAFSREVYDMVRDHYIAEYEAGKDISGYIDMDRTNIIKHREGYYMVRVMLNGVRGSRMFRLSDKETEAFMAVAGNPAEREKLTLMLAQKHLLRDDAYELSRKLRYDDIFNPSGMKEVSGLTKQIARIVRNAGHAVPGTPVHTTALSRQVAAAGRALKTALTQEGGSQDDNREYEVGSRDNGYEAEIEAENSGISY